MSGVFAFSGWHGRASPRPCGVPGRCDPDSVRSLLLLSGVAFAGYHRDIKSLRQFGASEQAITVAKVGFPAVSSFNRYLWASCNVADVGFGYV